MFANLKKKIESEVGDLSRLNLRSITSMSSEKMTPLSSRHNSVSSLASETASTSLSNKLSSPLSPQQDHTSASASRQEVGGNGGKNDKDNIQQRIRRQFEEKIQTLELDFAWRLSSKDEELAKLQKQVDHLSSLLHSKEYETQQKLVRVQEDMDSLEGFSQQENAKIKHLLLNKEEELSQLKAAVMSKDSEITEFQSHVKNITMENERLKKSLDEVIGRTPQTKQEDVQALEQQSKLVKQQNEELAKLRPQVEKLQEIEEQNKELVLKVSEIQSKNNLLKEEINQSGAKTQNLLLSKEEELNQLKDELSAKNVEASEFQSITEEYQHLKQHVDKVNEHAREQANIGNELKVKLSELQSQVDKFESVKAENEQLKKDLEEVKVNQQARVQDNAVNKESDLLLAQLQSQVEEFGNLELENKELVLKISHLQSECDLLKEKVQKADTKAEDLLLNKEEEIKSALTAIESMKEENEQFKKTLEEVHEHAKVQASLENELRGQLLQKESNVKSIEKAEKENQALTLELSKLQSEYDQLKEQVNQANEKYQQLLSDKDEKLKSLESALKTKDSIIKESVVILKEENEQLKKSLEQARVQSNEESKLKAQLLAQIQSQVEEFGNLELENKELVLQMSHLQSECNLSKEKVQEANAKAEDLLLNKVEESEKIKSALTAQLESVKEENEQLKKNLEEVNINEHTRIQDNRESDQLLAQLQSQVEEFGNLELENNELVLQISEIQSKYDELLEENKFLKEATPKPSQEDQEAKQRRISEMEGELLDKTQMLKQQSLQLQDLRRSLAKEINKNQALSESASPASEPVSQSQSLMGNGAMMHLLSAQITPLQPPTLPPQETDVNFMYLRSVLFKYLTTTDAQVSTQLTRVVATLLHLSEEESHLLGQAMESKNNSFFHLKS